MYSKQAEYVIGAFTDRQQEDRAVKELRKAGFENELEVAAHRNDPEAQLSVAQALQRRGFEADEARFYQEQFRSGADLVMVHADGRRGEAEAILARCGWRTDQQPAVMMNTAATPPTPAAQPATTPPVTTAAPERPATAHAAQVEPKRTVPLKEERLEIHKEPVKSDVVIRKDVETERKTMNVPVTREEPVIERRPVSGTEPARGPIGSKEEIHVPLATERVEVEKKPVVTEELVIGKKPVQENKTISETVRKETARVERKP